MEEARLKHLLVQARVGSPGAPVGGGGSLAGSLKSRSAADAVRAKQTAFRTCLSVLGRAIVSRIVIKMPIQTGRYTNRTKQETDYGSTPLVEDRAFLLS